MSQILVPQNAYYPIVKQGQLGKVQYQAQVHISGQGMVNQNINHMNSNANWQAKHSQSKFIENPKAQTFTEVKPQQQNQNKRKIISPIRSQASNVGNNICNASQNENDQAPSNEHIFLSKINPGLQQVQICNNSSMSPINDKRRTSEQRFSNLVQYNQQAMQSQITEYGNNVYVENNVSPRDKGIQDLHSNQALGLVNGLQNHRNLIYPISRQQKDRNVVDQKTSNNRFQEQALLNHQQKIRKPQQQQVLPLNSPQSSNTNSVNSSKYIQKIEHQYQQQTNVNPIGINKQVRNTFYGQFTNGMCNVQQQTNNTATGFNQNVYQSQSTTSTATNSTFFEQRLASQSRIEKKRLKPLVEQQVMEEQCENEIIQRQNKHSRQAQVDNCGSTNKIERVHSFNQMQFQTMQNFYTNALSQSNQQQEPEPVNNAKLSQQYQTQQKGGTKAMRMTFHREKSSQQNKRSKAASSMSKYYARKNFNPADIRKTNMILIEEDEDKLAEESCPETANQEATKENKNYNNRIKIAQKTQDNFEKPRAIENKHFNSNEHGIKFEVQRDKRIVNHLQKEPTESLNLMFYDFNNCQSNGGSNNPYQNNPSQSSQRRCFSKGGDRVPTRERGCAVGTRQQNLRRSILLSRGVVAQNNNKAAHAAGDQNNSNISDQRGYKGQVQSMSPNIKNTQNADGKGQGIFENYPHQHYKAKEKTRESINSQIKIKKNIPHNQPQPSPSGSFIDEGGKCSDDCSQEGDDEQERLGLAEADKQYQGGSGNSFQKSQRFNQQKAKFKELNNQQ